MKTGYIAVIAGLIVIIAILLGSLTSHANQNMNNGCGKGYHYINPNSCIQYTDFDNICVESGGMHSYTTLVTIKHDLAYFPSLNKCKCDYTYYYDYTVTPEIMDNLNIEWTGCNNDLARLILFGDE